MALARVRFRRFWRGGLRRNGYRRRGPAIAHRTRLELEVVLERAVRPQVELGEHRVVRLHGLDGADDTVDDQPQELHKRELILSAIDLAPEERNLRPILLRIGQK